MEFNWKWGVIGSIVILAMSACVNRTPEQELAFEEKWDNIHNCLPIPDDLPKKYECGPYVKWNCTLQSSYNDGDLRIAYPENGDKTTCEFIEYVDHDGKLIKCDFEKMTHH